MKSLGRIRRVCLIALAAIGFVFTGQAVAQPGVEVPIESFYDELAPYGQWSQYPGYGDVWRPDADPDFQPYASNGHWVVTEYGNTWVSDYDWGWAPFHYGRWILDPAYGGWLWVPGRDWGPAWVSWRSGGGYYGWAPLGPGVNVNVNINIPAPYWTFVPQVYITSPRLYSYCVPRPRVVNIYQNTTIINNVYRSNNRAYVYGPQRGEIERVTRRSVPVYRVDRIDRPGRTVVSNGSVGFYRPNPSAGNRRDYGRVERFDNSRNGQYDNNRGNGGYSAPSRDYNRADVPNTNPSYSRAYPSDRRGGYSSGATPNPGSYTTPNRNERVEPAPSRSDRYEPNRGRYVPNEGNAAPGTYSPQQAQPSRTFEQPSRQRPYMGNTPPSQSRQEGTFQRGADNRGQSIPQRIQESNPRPTGDRGQFTPGERSSRGPR